MLNTLFRNKTSASFLGETLPTVLYISILGSAVELSHFFLGSTWKKVPEPICCMNQNTWYDWWKDSIRLLIFFSCYLLLTRQKWRQRPALPPSSGTGSHMIASLWWRMGHVMSIKSRVSCEFLADCDRWSLVICNVHFCLSIFFPLRGNSALCRTAMVKPWPEDNRAQPVSYVPLKKMIYI